MAQLKDTTITGNLNVSEDIQIGNISVLAALGSVTVDAIYPVGSIYMSVNSTNPSTLFGGTWEQLQGKFLLGADTTYIAGTTGGAASVTLTTDQMPSHTHTFTGSSATSGNQSASHTHSGTTDSKGAHTHNVKYSQYGTSSGSFHVLRRDHAEDGYINTNAAAMSAGAHTHTMTTGNQSASHTHTVTAKGSNSSTGGGGSHNNMPPYLAVYMWKRTA